MLAEPCSLCAWNQPSRDKRWRGCAAADIVAMKIALLLLLFLLVPPLFLLPRLSAASAASAIP